MESKEQKDLDSWDGFTGSQNFLKADMVENESQGFVCKDVELDDEGERPRLNLTFDKEEYLFDLNVTNSVYLKENGINKPSELKGKKIYFRKVSVISPKTKKEVESLRIKKVE
jgi:hypothetical protein